MSERLTQKEIKHDIREDEVLHYINHVLAWVINHSRQLLAGGVAFVLLILGAVGFRSYQDGQQDKASWALGKAIDVAQSPVVAEGATPDDADNPSFPDEASRREKAQTLFEGVRADYSGTGSAAAATIHLGRLALEEGNAEGARTLWEDFLKGNKDHMLASSVKVSLLALDRDAGNGDAVVEELESQLVSKKPLLPQDVALYQLAITLEELERNDEAADVYRRLGDEHPDSPFASRALVKARELDPTAVS